MKLPKLAGDYEPFSERQAPSQRCFTPKGKSKQSAKAAREFGEKPQLSQSQGFARTREMIYNKRRLCLPDHSQRADARVSFLLNEKRPDHTENAGRGAAGNRMAGIKVANVVVTLFAYVKMTDEPAQSVECAVGVAG